MTAVGRPSHASRPPTVRGRLLRRGIHMGLRQMNRNRPPISPDADLVELDGLLHAMRERFENLASRQVPMPGVTVQHVDLGGVSGDEVRVGAVDDTRVVLHLHGGAYILCSPRTHRQLAISLGRRTGMPVVLPDYRLAPEHPFPAALDDAMAAWDALTIDRGIDPKHVAVTGDSAGGGLGLALCLRLRDEGREQPGCYVGLSPWTDLTGSGRSNVERAHRDPMLPAELVHLPARAYAVDTPLEHPYLSPVFGDYTGICPILVHVGSEEIIHDDSTRVVARAREHGAVADLGVFEGMWHVFQAFGPSPEAARSLREVGGFIRRNLAG